MITRLNGILRAITLMLTNQRIVNINFYNSFQALRKTMLRAHRQAWAWQDEWHGLTMEDIRVIEKQTADALKRKMGQDDSDSQGIFYFLFLNHLCCMSGFYWKHLPPF